MLTASRERGVIGCREIDAQHPDDRCQDARGLTQRSVEDETERQGGFDGQIGILEWPAPPADASRCPRGDRVGREPEGDVASPHEGSVVLGPVPDAIRCRVRRMHARLHIAIMTRRRSRWSTCRPLLAHRAESAHQRRLPGGRAPLRGGASHEAEGWRGARGGGAGRVRAPAGRRLCLLCQIGYELVAGVEQFLLVDDVVAVEDGPALVAGQEHSDPFGDVRTDQVAGGGAAAIVEEAGRHPSGLAGGAPRGAPAPDGDAVAVEDEQAVGVTAGSPSVDEAPVVGTVACQFRFVHQRVCRESPVKGDKMT